MPLRFQVEIYSGITPPAALLDAMATHPQTVPPRPTAPTNAPTYDPAYPPQLGTAGAPAEDEAPPSYEDAMADDIVPVDGPRREYSGVTDVNAPNMDEKTAAPKYSAQQGNPGPGPGGPSGSGGFSAVV